MATAATIVARASAASAGARLFRDHVLKRSPGNDRKDGVVENQELHVAGAAVEAGADTADDDRDREREEEERQQKLARAARGGHARKQRADGADPEVGERDADEGAAVDPGVEEEREGRQRDDLGRDEEGQHRDRLPEPDRAPIRRGEHEPVEHVLLALGSEAAGQAEQRREDQRHPEQAERREPRGVLRQREVEDDERRDDEEQHRRQRVPRAQLEPQILARERPHVAQVAHATRAFCAEASGANRDGAWVATRNVARCRSSASSRSSSAAPSASSAVKGSSKTYRSGSWRKARQSASRWSIPRENDDTRSRRASHSRKRSSSIPIRSRRSGTRYRRP